MGPAADLDLAVVGAGVVGTMAAYFAAERRPDWRIALVDRSLVGCGATLYSAGLDLPYGHTPRKRGLAATSTALYPRLAARVAGVTLHEAPFYGVVRRGSAEAVSDGFVGGGVREVDARGQAPLRGAFPDLVLAPDHVVLGGPTARYGDAGRIAQALARHVAREHGVRCWEGVEVKAVEAVGGGLRLHTADGRALGAARVLAALGPWGVDGLGAEAARAAGMRRKKIVALHLDRRPPPGAPVLFFFDEDAFLLPLHDRGHWLFSFTVRTWDCGLDVSRLRITAEDRALGRAVLGAYCPALAEEARSGRVFCDAYLPDGTPAVYPGGADGFVLAGGGVGVRLPAGPRPRPRRPRRPRLPHRRPGRAGRHLAPSPPPAMWIRPLDRDALTASYGALCQYLYPWDGVVEPPFGSAWCVVAPRTATRGHAHHEGETFFVARGRGQMSLDGETATVGAGDTVYIPPFTAHELRNLSDEEDLLFLTVWWEDLGLAEAHRAPDPAAGRPREVLVLPTPPTPNGDLHVGHLAGPYLAADVHARYARMRGRRAALVTGADDHQSWTAYKGAQTDATPTDVAETYSRAIRSTLRAAGVEVGCFVEPRRTPRHAAIVGEVVEALYRGGKLLEKDAPSLWCEPCDRYLYEVYVRGECPHCGAGTAGNICEACGRPNDCADLVGPVCAVCGTPPARRTLRRLYFPLSDYAAPLRAHLATAHVPCTLQALCDRMLEEGLPDVPVTHVTDWGLPVPAPGYEDQRLSVWFEMGPGYLAATDALLGTQADGGPGRDWRAFWRSEEAEKVHFMGTDNVFFHALLFPAIYHAYDPSLRAPGVYVVNEFYRLEGLKFSTSRGHAIWGRDLFGPVPPDFARFYLGYTRPETAQTSFSRSDFDETVRREILGTWQPWLEGLGATLQDEFRGAAPSTGVWTAHHRQFYGHLLDLGRRMGAAYEATSFSLQQATRTLGDLVRAAHRFGQSEAHWRGIEARRDERRTGVALELAAAKALALWSAPLMPTTARALWTGLGFDGTIEEAGWGSRPDWVPGGQPVGPLGDVYPRSAGTAVGAAGDGPS